MTFRIKNNQAGNMVLLVILGVVLAAVIGLAGWRVFHKKNVADTVTTSSVTQPKPTSVAQPASTSASDSSLNSGLSGINSSLSQENSSENSSQKALNDGQSQIAVPTN